MRAALVTLAAEVFAGSPFSHIRYSKGEALAMAAVSVFTPRRPCDSAARKFGKEP
jgi:hypothetical protein